MVSFNHRIWRFFVAKKASFLQQNEGKIEGIISYVPLKTSYYSIFIQIKIIISNILISKLMTYIYTLSVGK
ncbi:hypothetical protein Hanom_Chr07g00620091 [Helianthus anomalus]